MFSVIETVEVENINGVKVIFVVTKKTFFGLVYCDVKYFHGVAPGICQ